MSRYAAIIIGFSFLKLNAHAHGFRFIANGGYSARGYANHFHEGFSFKQVVWEHQFNAGRTSRQFVSN